MKQLKKKVSTVISRKIGLRAAMGLSEKPEWVFENAIEFLRETAKRGMLDVNASITNQAPEAWNRYIRWVLKNYPLFREYEDGWPIWQYLQTYLRDRRKKNALRRERRRLIGSDKTGGSQHEIKTADEFYLWEDNTVILGPPISAIRTTLHWPGDYCHCKYCI